MQNVQTSPADDNDNLDLEQGPPSLSSVRDIITPTKSPTPSSDIALSDTEARTKVKGRSRFSTAIRKLSGSTRKKRQSSKDTSPQKEPAESVANVEIEEPKATTSQSATTTTPEEEKLKKKNRLSKRFLLPALKKSKISPKTNINEPDNDDGSQRNLDQVTNAELEQKPPEDRGAITTCKSPKQSRVQITISGKKVGSVELSPASATGETARPIPGDGIAKSKGATDTKTKATTAPATPTSATTSKLSAAEPSKPKKKLKLKKSTTTTTTTTTTTASVTSSTRAQSISDSPKETEEKLVITQSTRDTPPNEQAPIKPSRTLSVDPTISQSPEDTETTAVICKPTARTAGSLSPFSLSQRFSGSAVRSIVGKKQRASTKAASVETDLMQTPSSSSQRGHRLPRPSSTTSTTQPSTTASTLEQATPPRVLSPQQQELEEKLQQQRLKQRQIQFQLQSSSESQSHDSQSLAREQQLQSNVSSTQLQPPTYPPPPVPHSPAPTPETRSPAPTAAESSRQQHHQHTIYADDSVATASSSGADEFLSSAESATNQEDYDAEVASYLAGVAKDTDRLRRQGTASYDSTSDSPLSESSRKRIHFVAQSTISDDLENRRKGSDDYRLSTEAGEDTFESDINTGDKQMPAFGNLTMDEEMEPTIMTSANAEKREHLYKILVIGELGTGKTSFIKRYVHQFFSQNYRATIGVDFALKVLHWDSNTIVRLQLWDIAGQERFGNMTRVYYKEAVGAFIVFDVTRSGTFECVSKWKEDLDSKVQLPDGSPIPCILLANKCDQEKQGVVAQSEKMDEYVKENGFAGWFETSAKENINIDEAARALVSKILLNDKLISASDLADSEKFNLNNTMDQTDSESKKCSC